jgi:hypothetical protein
VFPSSPRGPSAVSPSKKGKQFRGLLCRRPPSDRISTNTRSSPCPTLPIAEEGSISVLGAVDATTGARISWHGAADLRSSISSIAGTNGGGAGWTKFRRRHHGTMENQLRATPAGRRPRRAGCRCWPRAADAFTPHTCRCSCTGRPTARHLSEAV